MGSAVDGGDAFGVDLLVPANIGTHARLELVASGSKSGDLPCVLVVGENLAFNDDLPSFDERATLPDD